MVRRGALAPEDVLEGHDLHLRVLFPLEAVLCWPKPLDEHLLAEAAHGQLRLPTPRGRMKHTREQSVMGTKSELNVA